MAYRTNLFHQQTVASLPEVMAALGTRARRTAFRKLKERTSYSHPATTPWELIDFDQHGLWSFRAVGSRPPAPCSPPPQRWSAMRQRDNSVRSWTTCFTSAPSALISSRQADRRNEPRRPHPQGAATERPARPAGRPPGEVGPVPDADMPRTNCAPLSCCSPACSMNASAGCTPALSPSSAVGRRRRPYRRATRYRPRYRSPRS